MKTKYINVYLKRNLKKLMFEKGISAYQLARYTGVSKNNIYRIINPEYTGDCCVSTVIAIAKYFNVSLDELVNRYV